MTESKGARAGLVKPAIAVVAVLLAAAGGFFSWRHFSAATDISGVWHSPTSNLTYVIDKHDDGYRLSVGGHRLQVKSVERDSMTGQLVLGVRTDSGLLALWSFRADKDTDGSPLLQLDEDGFANDQLHLQRQLTSVDRSRLLLLKVAKKPLWTPSFDCGRADTDAERMVCSDRSLAALDVQMAERYQAVTNDASVVEAQKTWVHDVRDACTDINCLHTAYQQRLSDLGGGDAAAAEAPSAADAGAAAPDASS